MGRIVYHYTSPDGIYSILKNKTLWFTDCQYLNDKNEFIYISQPLSEAWKKICGEFNEPYNNEDVNFLIERFLSSPYQINLVNLSKSSGTKSKQKNHIISRRYYALCTSGNADTSNMWNYYVKNGSYQGYNLGIDETAFRERIERFSDNKIELIADEVVYDPDKQVEKIYLKMKECIKNYDEIFNEDAELRCKIQYGFFDFLNEAKLFFKNPAFENEKEYRFILRVDNDFRKKTLDDERLSIEYRVGTSGIITPYIEWHFDLDVKAELFKEITLAPMVEADLAKESFNRFLDATVKSEITIKQSSIRLRF